MHLGFCEILWIKMLTRDLLFYLPVHLIITPRNYWWELTYAKPPKIPDQQLFVRISYLDQGRIQASKTSTLWEFALILIEIIFFYTFSKNIESIKYRRLNVKGSFNDFSISITLHMMYELAFYILSFLTMHFSKIILVQFPIYNQPYFILGFSRSWVN